MSCVEILVVLYWKIMKPRDIFILSAGWKAAAVYSVLAEKGIIPKKDLMKHYYHGKYAGLISHHVPGVFCSTGSAGHGLPMAIGAALADRSRKVYVLMSDGEMNCGSTWESALIAAHHKLNNLVVIVDCNGLQAFGKTNEVLRLGWLKEKWEAFDWNACEMNGHNLDGLKLALNKYSLWQEPLIVIAHTVKGKGVKFAENKLEWHYKNLTKKLYEDAITGLSQQKAQKCKEKTRKVRIKQKK